MFLKKIFIFLFFIIACKSNFTKPVEYKRYYDNGVLRDSIDIENDKKNGNLKSFYKDGKIATIGYFKNDERDKTWKFYDEETGLLSSIENYKNGMLEGRQFYYYPNGKLKLRSFYDRNKKFGTWISYFESGKPKIIARHYDDENLVIITSFEENGKILSSGLLKNGEKNGVWRFFDENGKILYDINYLDSVPNGVWRAYNEKGEKILQEFFYGGNLVN